MPDVTYTRSDYSEALARWRLTEDACAGEAAVKKRAAAYLPVPNPEDESEDNRKRYANYLARAVFYNAAQRTLQGLVGTAFRRIPTLTLPEALRYVEDDMDGAGVSIYQQSQDALEHAIKAGRAGLLVDYPATEAPASLREQQSGFLRPTATLYPATAIINWRTERVGNRHRLALVVISEQVEEAGEDGFGVESVEQHRVLRLVDGLYVVEVWRKDRSGWHITEAREPLDGAGRRWTEIPFTFIGASNNDPSIDAAPLYDLAVLNLAHYRNSADYEDSVFFVGQAQAWIAGLTEEWRDWLESSGLYIGARAPILLPSGGQFGFAQAQPNTLSKEAMDQKEAQMIALGARLIERGSATKTATEAQSDSEAEHSVLSLAASNVSEAYTKALAWMGQFMAAAGDALYAIAQDYTEHKLSPQDRQQLLLEWQSGGIAKKDYRDALRRGGVIDPERTDEEIDAEIEGSGDGLSLDAD